MKYALYPFETLYKEESADDNHSYTLRVKRYKLKSFYPLVTVQIHKVPLLANFDKMPDDYDQMCVNCEFRVRHSLSLQEMINIGRKYLADHFLQQSLAFD